MTHQWVCLLKSTTAFSYTFIGILFTGHDTENTKAHKKVSISSKLCTSGRKESWLIIIIINLKRVFFSSRSDNFMLLLSKAGQEMFHKILHYWEWDLRTTFNLELFPGFEKIKNVFRNVCDSEEFYC